MVPRDRAGKWSRLVLPNTNPSGPIVAARRTEESRGSVAGGEIGTEPKTGSTPGSRERGRDVEAVPGLVLGDRYVLQNPLERGAWGTVWKAEHNVLRKTFAVKLLRADTPEGSDDWAAARMLREARAVSQIRHPNVVDVVDFGHLGRSPYIVMEYLRGCSLQAELRKGPMSWWRARPLFLQAVEGLAAAHAEGITHRDVKPSNLFLVDEGKTLKVIDFGIAGAGKRLTRITTVGEVLGTPRFMSPEQTRGLDVTAGSDVYSLGCVAYAMLSGRPPFVGELPELIRQHLRTPPPKLREVASSDVPPEVCAILERCLAKAPAQRYPTMDALYQALTGHPIEPVRTPVSGGVSRARADATRASRRGTMLAATMAGLIVLGAVTTAGLLWRKRSESPPPTHRPQGVRVPAIAPAPPAAMPLRRSITEPAPPEKPEGAVPVVAPSPSLDPDVGGGDPPEHPASVRPHKRRPVVPTKRSAPGSEDPVSPDPVAMPAGPDPDAPAAEDDTPPIEKVGGLKNPFADG